jgi:hypothetical protein
MFTGGMEETDPKEGNSREPPGQTSKDLLILTSVTTSPEPLPNQGWR